MSAAEIALKPDWSCEEEREVCGEWWSVKTFWRLLDVDTFRYSDWVTLKIARRRDRPSALVLWQPLRTWAPEDSQPWVYGVGDIIFYRRPFPLPTVDGKGFQEWSRCKHVITSGFGDHWIDFEGERYVLGTGSVVWRGGRWWFRFSARCVMKKPQEGDHDPRT